MQTPSQEAPVAVRHSLAREWLRAAAVVVAIEVGLLLLSLPWTSLWPHTPWVQSLGAQHPALLQFWLSPYLRGAVSGLGLLNLWIATSEITQVRS